MRLCIVFVTIWSFLASISSIDAQSTTIEPLTALQRINDAATRLRTKIAALLGANKSFKPSEVAFRNDADALILGIDSIVSTQDDFPIDRSIQDVGGTVSGLLKAQDNLSTLLRELRELLTDYKDTKATVDPTCVGTQMNSYLTDIAEAITALIRENLLTMSNLLVVSKPKDLSPFNNVSEALELSLYIGNVAVQVIQVVLSDALGVTGEDAKTVQGFLDATRELVHQYVNATFTRVIHAPTEAVILITGFADGTATTVAR